MKRKSQEKEIEIKALRNQVTKLQHELQIAYVKLDTIRDTLALQQPTTWLCHKRYIVIDILK